MPGAPQGPDSKDYLVNVPIEGEIRIAFESDEEWWSFCCKWHLCRVVEVGREEGGAVAGSFGLYHMEGEKVPEDREKKLTVPLNKKGSLKQCDSYRGIGFLGTRESVLSCTCNQTRLAERAKQLRQRLHETY